MVSVRKNQKSVHALETREDFINAPIRPIIKLLLLIPLGFGISMLWQLFVLQSNRVASQGAVDIGDTIMEGSMVLLVGTLLIALPVFLIAGPKIRALLLPTITRNRLKHLVFSLFGVGLLGYVGLFTLLEEIFSELLGSVPAGVQIGVFFILVFVVSELSMRLGKLLFKIFARSRSKINE